MLRITLTSLLRLALNNLLAAQSNFCSCHNFQTVRVPISIVGYTVGSVNGLGVDTVGGTDAIPSPDTVTNTPSKNTLVFCTGIIEGLSICVGVGIFGGTGFDPGTGGCVPADSVGSMITRGDSPVLIVSIVFVFPPIANGGKIVVPSVESVSKVPGVAMFPFGIRLTVRLVVNLS